MKFRLIATGSALALAAFALPAKAADMRMAPPAAAMFDWSGFYWGLNAGWVRGKASAFGTSGSLNGAIIGGQIGVNQQVGYALYGAELDSAWTSISDSDSAAGVTVRYKANYEGSARLRAGLVNDRSLYYVTGGAAWTRSSLSASGLVSASSTNTHLGWTVGAGIEHAFSPTMTGRLEYRYSDYGSKSYFGAPVTLTSHMIRVGVNFLTH